MKYVGWCWASSMRCGHPSATSTPFCTTIFLSMSDTSVRGPLGDVFLPLLGQLVEFLHEPADGSRLARVLEQAVVHQVAEQNIHVREPPELVCRAILREGA